MIKVAINGYGRIGRNILKAYLSRLPELKDKIQIVAINDLSDINTSAHLTEYDSVHGRLPKSFEDYVKVEGNSLLIEGLPKIKYYSEKDPVNLPWKELGVDVVYECTGIFKSKQQCEDTHIKAGAKKVLISAPASEDVDATVVFGVNHDVLTGSETVVSNASCTTNCLAPIAKILNDNFGIKSGLMNTIHSYTGDQRLVDTSHSDLYRTRGAATSMIPTKTGAAKALGLVIPELEGRVNGLAIRVPTPNVSVVDFTCNLEKPATVEEINALMKEASEGSLKDVLGYCDKKLVSVDFTGMPYSSIFDANQTYIVEGNMVKVFSWYDNEMGFSHRMLDTSIYWSEL